MGAREKLALFNMLGERITGATVLDAFAGSGALGIEALSRGAEQVVFVEKNPHAAKVIQQNLASLGLEKSGAVVRQSVKEFVKNQLAWQNEADILGPLNHEESVNNQLNTQNYVKQNDVDLSENVSHKNPTPRQFGLILVDPPYDDFELTEVENLAQLLALGGILALSHPGEALALPGLDLTKTHSYARANISLYRKS